MKSRQLFVLIVFFGIQSGSAYAGDCILTLLAVFGGPAREELDRRVRQEQLQKSIAFSNELVAREHAAAQQQRPNRELVKCKKW